VNINAKRLSNAAGQRADTDALSRGRWRFDIRWGVIRQRSADGNRCAFVNEPLAKNDCRRRRKRNLRPISNNNQQRSALFQRYARLGEPAHNRRMFAAKRELGEVIGVRHHCHKRTEN
jgi:hypothetical protein